MSMPDLPMSNRLKYAMDLNQMRQGIIQTEDALTWFEKLQNNQQTEVLQLLSYMVMQAGATMGDVPLAIVKANIKPTHTPAVLLQKSPLSAGVSKAIQLPANERDKSFKLILSLFVIADGRRADSCGNECGHWWHKDLSDELYLRDIRELYRNGIL